MTNPITVVISKELCDRLQQSPIHIGVNALERLRAEGVPVVGALWPMGVTSGVLTSGFDEMFEEYTYEWRP